MPPSKRHTRKVRRLLLVIDMKIDDDEYKILRDLYMKEEFAKAEPKPSGMYGTWGWYTMKERELQEKLRQEGKLE